MYKIGDFAKIVDLPVRTLRFYDECGILKPSMTDNYTGYRYYTEKDIAACQLIKLLKSVDFSLVEILNNKDNLNNEMLKTKQNELEEKIYLLKLKWQKLAIMQEAMTKEGLNPTNIKDTQEELILRRKYEKRSIR
jgi:MerR family transcriptional regulator, activator of bmr gene